MKNSGSSRVHICGGSPLVGGAEDMLGLRDVGFLRVLDVSRRNRKTVEIEERMMNQGDA